MNEELILTIYNTVLVLVAFYVGILAGIFTKLFIKLNSSLLHKMGMHKQAEDFNTPGMYVLAKILGLFFLIGTITTTVQVFFDVSLTPINLF